MSTYRIGPGEDCDYKGPVELLAANVLRPGDLVEVMPATYRAACKYIYPTAGSTIPITFRGVPDASGKRPVFDGRGKMLEAPRAFFEFYGSTTQGIAIDGAWAVENIDFQYAKNNDNDMNAAGVRSVNAASVRVVGCRIWNCASGVMSGNKAGEIVIEDCDIGFAGFGDGHSHCIYVQGRVFRCRNSRIHDSTMGQVIKTRNRFVEIAYNQIYSSRDGEVGIIQNGNGTAAESEGGLTGEPGANAIVVDNEIVTRRDRAEGHRANVITFGRDMGVFGRNGTLYCHGNRIYQHSGYNVAITLSSDRVSLDARHNKFLGVSKNIFLDKHSGAVLVSGELNWAAPDALVPSAFVRPAVYQYEMGGQSSVADPGRRSVRTILSAPGNVRDYPEEGGWAIRWDPVPGATFYRIWRYIRLNGVGKTGATVWGGAVEPWWVDCFQHYPSTEGTKREYVYQIEAVDFTGSKSPMSQKWVKEHGAPGYPLPPQPATESEGEEEIGDQCAALDAIYPPDVERPGRDREL